MSVPLRVETHASAEERHEEAPPFLGSWRNVYLFLAGELLLTVLIFWVLTRWAS